MSDTSDSEYEACDGLFACNGCYENSDWDMEDCCDGVCHIVCPCKEDIEDESCVYNCCGNQVRPCSKCTTVFGVCGACLTAFKDFFVALYKFVLWIFNFEQKRRWLYGKDVDPKNNGRLPVIHRWVGEQTEHWLMCLFSVLLSIVDTGSDVYVIHKWLTYDPHEWEALCLIIVLLFSWTVSVWLRIHWVPEGDDNWSFDDEDEEGGGCCKKGGCCCKWICSSAPFHFMGLGVTAEGLKALGDYDGIQDNYRNVNPFKWVEILFESGPSALLMIYVISKNSISANDKATGSILAELVSGGISLFFIAWGMASTFTQEIPRGKDTKDIGERSAVRLAFAIILVLCDLVFRLFLITMWVNYGNILGITQTWLKFIIGMSAVWVFEMIIVSMNGMIAAWWQIPIQAYTQIFQGGIGFFSRSWPRDDKKNRGHKRNILTFCLRYAANWGVFLWIYFMLSKQEGSYISKVWTDIMIIFAACEPLFFMLKPPAVSAREAFPYIQMVTEMGWRQGRNSYISRKATPAVQMTSVAKAVNPAGGRVNYGNQSMQNMNLTDDDSDFV